MKKTITAITVLLSIGAISTQAALYTFTNDTNNQQGEVRSTTPLDGSPFPATGSSVNQNNLRVGEYKNLSDAWLARDVVKFGFSSGDLGAGETVTNATLRLYVDVVSLNAGTGPGSSVLLSYSRTDAASTVNVAGDFEDASFTLIGTMAGLNSTTTTGAWYEFDVTAAVLDDLANDVGPSSGSSFRMQLNDDVLLTPTDALDYITFRDYSDTAGANAPELILETIPEPATIGLVALFGGSILFIRRHFMM